MKGELGGRVYCNTVGDSWAYIGPPPPPPPLAPALHGSAELCFTLCVSSSLFPSALAGRVSERAGEDTF
eukprot:3407048-Pyramimonas_sp.AAC.1